MKSAIESESIRTSIRKLDLAKSLLEEVRNALELRERICTGCLHGPHSIKLNYADYKLSLELNPAINKLARAIEHLQAPEGWNEHE